MNTDTTFLSKSMVRYGVQVYAFNEFIALIEAYFFGLSRVKLSKKFSFVAFET